MPDVRWLRPRFEKALVLEHPDPSLDDYLREQGLTVERLPEEATQDRAHVLERLREGQHDLLFKRSRFVVDDEVLAASDRLAAVLLCCIGDDSVDKAACAARGVMVMNDPVSNGRSVAEMVFGEMIVLARPHAR
jgi:D-3-phosphoglycerate dehydrogenase / 2-oxoglutarate reductase